MEHRNTTLKAQRIQQQRINEDIYLLSFLPVRTEKLRDQLMNNNLLKDDDTYKKLEKKLTQYEDRIRSIRSRRKSKYAYASIFSTESVSILSK